VGIASPNWKTGRYSKHMPKGLGELAYDAANDPELLDLTELIGVYQARIQDTLEKIGSGASMERFREVKVAWEKFQVADANRNKGEVQAALNQINYLLNDIDHDWLAWKDLDVAAKNLKLLMESERKRRIEMAGLIPTQKAANFARELVLAVRAEVTDQAVLARIHNRVEEIMGAQTAILEADDG
jgi:hypothetical protein